MNRLIWGDNLLAMQALLAQGYEGAIDLIYIDPPFDSKADYSHAIKLPGSEITKEPSVIERLAYKDTWAGGVDSYLDMLYPRLQVMKRLLSERGSLYLHCDSRVNSYARLLLDEIFGKDNFVNQIVWAYEDVGGRATNYFKRKSDTILLFQKTDQRQFNVLRKGLSESTIKRYKPYLDERGQITYRQLQATNPGVFAKLKGVRDLDEVWLDINNGAPLNDWWTDISPLKEGFVEYLGYDTQKPEALLERIIKASSCEGDLVADFFSGSGTTLAVAERLGRRWLGCELGKVGVQVARGRLVRQEAGSYLIENVGNYQREMIYLSGARIGEMQKIVLKLYGAEPRKDYADLGVKAGSDGGLELVYVGYPDRALSARKVEELVRLAEKLDGRGYKRLVALAWDFDYNFSTELEKRRASAKPAWQTDVDARFIPPDIYDYLKKAKSEDELEPLRNKVQFFQKPYLKLAEPIIHATGDGEFDVSIGIERYVTLDLPVAEKEREGLLTMARDNFAVLIDYWSIDWDYDGVTFRSEWQDLRGFGKRTKVVATNTTKHLPPGSRTIAVRVVDIFGNDAGATLKLNV